VGYIAPVRAYGYLAIAVTSGCIREPAQAICPTISTGDLVVTEIRGPQDDALGAWVEIYNASGGDLDLIGLQIRFRKKDGSSETDVLVRRSLPAASASYTVLGLFDDGALPAYVDYGFQADFHDSWLAAAAVDVDACGTLIDRAIYDSLPKMGTFSLGAMPPSADANDLPANWCTDATAGNAGTPQQPNIACP
jgi:hypothetical protein